MKTFARIFAVFLVGGLAYGFYEMNQRFAEEPGSFAAGPQFDQAPTTFEDPEGLLTAIEEDVFAERAGIQDELAAAKPIPGKIQIPFVSGTDVPAKQTATLEDFAERIAQRDDVALRVVGCADPPGSAALNERISQQRAESVADALMELGIEEARFDEVIGRGEDCKVPERVVNVVPIRTAMDVASN